MLRVVALLALVLGVLGAGVIVPGARAEGACPNEALRLELHSGALPDCRAYEQVTPPFKDGARVVVTAVSADGGHLIVKSLGNFGDAVNNQSLLGAAYELTRTSTGWREAGIDLPGSQYPWDQILGASADLSATLWAARASSQSIYAKDLFIRDADGTLHDLGPVSPPAETEGPPGVGESATGVVRVTGASSDLSHVLFRIAEEGRLWPGDTTRESNESLYEHAGFDASEPKLVGVRNSGPLDSNTEAELIGECGVSAGAANGRGARNAISADGSIVFFTPTGADDYACGGIQPPVDELYARIDGQKTVDISEPILPPGTHCTEACAAATHTDAVFQGASDDGRKVFFLTAQPLRNSDSDTQTDLYEAELEGEGAGAHVAKLVQVSHDPTPGQPAQALGVAQVSEDGARVYFVARGVLTTARNGLGQEAEAGGNNLYVYDTSTQQTGFVAALSEADEADWILGGGGPVQSTPDGRFTVLASTADLTPDDTSTAAQLFRYDAETGSLLRISVGESGFNSNGNTDTFAATLPFSTTFGSAANGLAISDDGAYIVFRSPDGLTPDALNGQTGYVTYEAEEEMRTRSYLVNNIYEYHLGEVSLISDGQDGTATYGESSVQLVGMTPRGGDVFFQSADRLVPQDTDTERDIYDARIEGGFTASALSRCEGEACRGAVGAPLASPSAGSATQAGGGNLTPGMQAGKPKGEPKQVARPQKLARALRACKKKPKRQQALCKVRARKLFGVRSTKKASGRVK